MNMHLGDILTGISFAGRNPSWREYETGTPAEKRAIVKRWSEVEKTSRSRDERDSAFYNWHRATLGCLHEDDPRRPRNIKDELCEEFERQDDWTTEKVETV